MTKASTFFGPELELGCRVSVDRLHICRYTGPMANCRYCSEEIFFAWHPEWLRWCPIEPESISGEEQLYENAHGQPGVVYAKWHRRHHCSRGRWRRGEEERAQEEARRREYRPPPRSPPRAAPPPPRSESWAHAALFVTADAPLEVIRAAYKALAMLYHPDRGGDPELMVELNRAYETLLGKN